MRNTKNCTSKEENIKNQPVMENQISKLVTITEPSSLVCDFCKTNEVDKLIYGDMYALEDVVTHYYCLLFASGLKQRGKDHDGIMGFILDDINGEKRRGSRLACQFCFKKGATIGCAIKRCNQMYHFHCGLANKANFQFHSRFESYCVKHCPIQKAVLAVNDASGNLCPICLSVADDDPFKIVPSCCKGALFHKTCLQIQALNSGYFFKCPMCNDNKLFISEMKNLGIFVPLKDASWETEPNAFEELNTTHSTCDSENCICPTGKTTVNEKGDFSLAVCVTCGAAGTHKICARIRSIKNWSCGSCIESLKKLKIAASSSSKAKEPGTGKSRKRKLSKNGEKPMKRPRTSPSDLPIDFSLLKMSKHVYKYFPYKKEQLIEFGKKSNIPDWRKLSLNVNLVKNINITSIKNFYQPLTHCELNYKEKNIEATGKLLVREEISPPNNETNLTMVDKTRSVEEPQNQFGGTIEGDLAKENPNTLTVDLRDSADISVEFQDNDDATGGFQDSGISSFGIPCEFNQPICSNLKMDSLVLFQTVNEMSQKVSALKDGSSMENHYQVQNEDLLNNSIEETFMINNNIDMEQCNYATDEEFTYDQVKSNDESFYKSHCPHMMDDFPLDETRFFHPNSRDESDSTTMSDEYLFQENNQQGEEMETQMFQ